MQPLEGIRVVDLSQNLAGPYCTQTLGDLGAEVIKVEPPAGDPARAWGPPFHGGDSTIFLSANRHKTSITLDLKSPDDCARLHALVGTADVFVQSFRAGVIERLGFAEPVIRERHPSLIYCTISAYGREGPLREQPGYDPLMQAHAGLVSVTGHAGQPARIGTSVVDMGTGMWAAIGILAALRERERTGRGSHVGTALFETALAWNAYHIMGYLASGNVPAPVGTAFPLIAPYDAFPTRDGRLMIAAANDGLFAKLCDALNLVALKDDESVRTNPQRVALRSFVNDQVMAETLKHSTAELQAILTNAGVPCAPVLDVGEVVREEQTKASGMLQEVEAGGTAGRYTTVVAPLTFDGVRPPAGTVPRRQPST